MGKHILLADLREAHANTAAEADGGFITGNDMDGGVTAAYWYGQISELRT